MNKSELIDRLIDRFPALTRREVESSVATILGAITGQLAQGGRFEVRDFAAFSVHLLGGKLGRNPRTGEQVVVPPRYVVRFKPGKRLREGAVSSGGVAPRRDESRETGSSRWIPQPSQRL